MNRTLLQIKVLYETMGKSEKRIADWLFEHSGEIIPLSITELAERSSSSEATIVRFAKRLGFSGYQELKISFAQESGKKLINDDISRDDTCADIFEKISNDIYCSLEMTKNAIDPKSLETAAQAVLGANTISIFGLGNSAAVATDAAHKFLRAGCKATAYSDNHMQAIAASHLTDKDVAIGISHSGSSKDIVDALAISKCNGATTICITNFGKSPIIKQSGIVLCTRSKETEYSILGLNSRIAALAIIDAIYTYIICKSGDRAENAARRAEKALQSKKY